MENKTTNKTPDNDSKPHRYEYYDKEGNVLYKITGGRIEAIIDAPEKKEEPNGLKRTVC